MIQFSALRKLAQLTLLTSTIVLSGLTHAVTVLPGDTAALSGTTVAANPDLRGTVIRDVLIPFQIFDNLSNLIVSGNIQDRVVRSTNTGELIFAPRLRDFDTSLPDAWVSGISVTGYDGFATDIDFRTDGMGNVGPNHVDRSAGVGDSLFFGYDPNIITPNFGDEGYFLSTFTDATAFDLTGSITIFAQNDFGADVFSAILPETAAPSAVPIPAAVWLLGSGLIGLMGFARRKSNI